MSEFKELIRLVDTNIKGETKLLIGLTKIKGVSNAYANAICQVLSLDIYSKIGDTSPENLKKLEDALKNPDKYEIPVFLLNRRKDYDTGGNKHLLSSDLRLRIQFDIKRLQRNKIYRGVRHALKLPVRGQRTKAHFRKSSSLGVKKKATPNKKGK